MPRKDIEIIIKQLYPMVKKNIDSKTIRNFKKLMGEFIDSRYAQLYDIAP